MHTSRAFPTNSTLNLVTFISAVRYDDLIVPGSALEYLPINVFLVSIMCSLGPATAQTRTGPPRGPRDSQRHFP